MRVRFQVLRALAAAVVLAGPVLGYAVASHRKAGSEPKSHHVYRLDYLLTVTEPGKAPASVVYAMNVEDGSTGDVHAGANVPLQSKGPGTSPRQDVGLRLVSHVTRVGEDVLLHNTAELSAQGEEIGDLGARAISKIAVTDDAVLPLGKPTVVAKVEEPVSHARYDVVVTATKLR